MLQALARGPSTRTTAPAALLFVVLPTLATAQTASPLPAGQGCRACRGNRQDGATRSSGRSSSA